MTWPQTDGQSEISLSPHMPCLHKGSAWARLQVIGLHLTLRLQLFIVKELFIWTIHFVYSLPRFEGDLKICSNSENTCCLRLIFLRLKSSGLPRGSFWEFMLLLTIFQSYPNLEAGWYPINLWIQVARLGIEPAPVTPCSAIQELNYSTTTAGGRQGYDNSSPAR